MRVLELDGISALASVLIETDLLGAGAISMVLLTWFCLTREDLLVTLPKIQFFVGQVVLEL